MITLFRPQFVVAKIEDIDYTMLVERGVRGVMLDLDNTLAPWRIPQITDTVAAWGDRVREAGLKACILSNAPRNAHVRPVAERLGVPWIANAAKPFARGFQRGMELLGTTPATTAMVGDQVLTDVFGGNRLGLFTILVEPLCATEDWFTTRILRPIERFIGRDTSAQRS